MTRRPLRILVAGMLADDAGQGGASWALLHWVLGLAQLGHDVVVVDPLSSGDADATTSRYFAALCAEHDLCGRAALLRRQGPPIGMATDDLRMFIHRADLVCNVSGRLRDPELFAHVPLRLYVDVDPAFTQLWHSQGVDMGLEHHTHHVTVGTAITNRRSRVPSHGFDWHVMLPPVVLDEWPVTPPPDAPVLTSVANWRSYGCIEHVGVRYGQKAHSFRELLPIATRSPVPVAIALSIHAGDYADRIALVDAGWTLVDPWIAAGDTQRYRAFVQRSWAELGVAKSGYVAGRTGWFSDRSACYLATGRPVVAQDTSIDGALPTDAGLLTFTDADEAIERIHELRRDYARHARGARQLAETHLDARRVLGDLVQWVCS
ncbi:MAG TPA: hypothetical protein VGQ20_04330 [Acidimicrobiales bacterium]|jgi:hypothetical protein|nr:hypothetical protein [Acidimicrobiales bacterium]